MTATTTKRRTNLSLGWRVFLITALLIALSMGAAIAITSLLVQRIANQAVEEDLAATSSLQEALQSERFDRLQLISSLFVSDASIVAYFAEVAGAVESGDAIKARDARASILDLLDERQGALGFEFAIFLSPSGRVVVHTARPAMVGNDLSQTALVSEAVERSKAVTGTWREGDNLYSAVAVPLARGDFTLLGFLVTGFAIDDESAKDLQRMSGADVAFVATGKDSPPRVVASTLERRAATALAETLRSRPEMLVRLTQPAGMSQPVDDLTLGGEHFGARLAPLLDAKGDPTGALVALASIDDKLASYRQIQNVLIGAGALCALIAFFPTFWLTRRALSPVRRLAAAAEAARQGDYSRAIASESTDEVGQLARSFDHLLADLREKRDMEAYVTELSRTLPEPVVGHGAVGFPQNRDVLLMGLELRGYSRIRADSGPEQTLERLTQELKRLGETLATAGGRIETIAGHRVLARFEGRRRAYAALQASAEILRPFQNDQEESEWAAPMLALASGAVVTGPVSWSEQGAERATVGLPVQQLESLMREGTSGELLMSRGVYDEMKAVLEPSGYQLAPRRGVINPQPFYVLSANLAVRLQGLRPAPGVTSLTPAPEGTPTISISPGAVMGSRFEILSILGSGGMGVVYKARDSELDDLVALKMLRKNLLGDATQLDRLKSELKLARRITHPNVLRTFDFGEINGMPYISMEYVRGVTLRYLLDQNTERLPYSAGLRLAKQLCAGLAAAHSVGVIHRDIKPENLLLEPTGNAKLMDFGIAKPATRNAPGQTQEGFIVGTPQYMAPEQLQGKEADARSDIYSSGVVFYEIFTGVLPFTAPTAMEVMLKHLQQEPAPPTDHWPEIPPALNRIVLRCLKKEPTERYASVPELLRDLEGL